MKMNFIQRLCLWRKLKKEPGGHRHIYVGDIPEIEEQNDFDVEINKSRDPNIPKIPEEPEEPSVGETGNELHAEVDEEEEQEEVKPPPKTTTRRNSKATGIGRRLPMGPRNTQFMDNTIITSKYTFWSFLPKNLYQQFRRIVNFYFLCMAIIQSLIDSPVSPITSAAPLAFVIFVTSIKQGYEDWIRHKSDSIVNNRKVHIVKDGQLVAVKAKKLRVGDIVKLEGEEQVPADLIMIGSSDDLLRCQILTANLDGETNLKNRYCSAGLRGIKTEEDASKLACVIECEQPCSDLYMFNGSLLIPADKIPHSHGSTTSIPSGNDKKLVQGKSASPSPGANGGFGTLNNVNQVAGDIATSATGTGSTSEFSFNSTSRFVQLNVTMENLLLRGTKVKNIEFIYGLVVYTGEDTRLAQNSKITNAKFSTVERTVNKFLVTFIVLLFVLVGVCTGIHMFLAITDPHIYGKDAWYQVPIPKEVGFAYGFDIASQFLVLFNYIIPISLYVTMELQKFIGSKFFVWDLEMTCPNTGQSALCNTSDLNEELGQIEFLFSDKTGTLTENTMQFRYISIGGVRYDYNENEEKLYLRDDEQGINKKIEVQDVEAVRRFLLTLALCHTVQVMPTRRPSFEMSLDPDFVSKLSSRMKAADSVFSLEEPKAVPIGGGKWEFQASSPDEKALVEACYTLGVEYIGEKDSKLSVNVLGKVETYKRHHVLEFDPERKSMSVIVENSKGEYWLFIKGAETSVVPHCDSGPAQETLKHLVTFAMEGMRTLTVAQRKLTRQEFETFSSELKKTRRLIKHKEAKIKALYHSVESHLELLGATAVEDQLQEGVAETLQALCAAGIRVWVLTGDKLETAINVAISCGLITPGTKQIIVSKILDESAIKSRLKEIKSEMVEGENSVLIVDGESLNVAFSFCEEEFSHVAMNVHRVVCCRMAPLQKAQVVAMVKGSKGNPITAAVGDGANDVAMIQEAHIGLGILGKEGRQAARCADFALAKFKFLRKAILVHGHWYYVRLSILAIYFFYKNIVFILPQVYFSGFSAFATQSLFDAFFLTMFNIFFAACPIFTFGLQEQSHSAKTLIERPQFYTELRKNRLLTWRKFFIWNTFALYHSAICFFIPYLTWSTFEPETDLASFGTVVFCAVVAVSNMKMIIETKYFSGWTIFAHFYSYATFVILTGIYSEVDLRFIGLDSGQFRCVFFEVQSYLPFWLVMILVTTSALVPDLTYKCLCNSWSKIVRICRGKRYHSFRIEEVMPMPPPLMNESTGNNGANSPYYVEAVQVASPKKPVNAKKSASNPKTATPTSTTPPPTVLSPSSTPANEIKV